MQGRRLLERAVRLAPRNEAAFLEALAALALPEQMEPELRSDAIRDTLERAPHCRSGSPRSRPTPRSSRLTSPSTASRPSAPTPSPPRRLAEGAARACVELVATNLGVTEEDERLAWARRLAEAAADSARLVASPRSGA